MTERVDGSSFGLDELPYGIFSTDADGAGDSRRVGVAIGDQILDLAAFFDDPVFAQPTLNAFLAQGRSTWATVRGRLREAADSSRVAQCLVPRSGAVMHLPFDVADFVDFNSSLQHATNAGRILRPGDEPVRKNWRPSNSTKASAVASGCFQ